MTLFFAPHWPLWSHVTALMLNAQTQRDGSMSVKQFETSCIERGHSLTFWKECKS